MFHLLADMRKNIEKALCFRNIQVKKIRYFMIWRVGQHHTGSPYFLKNPFSVVTLKIIITNEFLSMHFVKSDCFYV